MEIVYDDPSLEAYMLQAVQVSPNRPVLVDKFLEDAVEVDVDAICDGEDVVIGGVMEHIEQAGVHSGDSACSLPPHSLTEDTLTVIRAQTRALAMELGVVGLLNIQYAIQGWYCVRTGGQPKGLPYHSIRQQGHRSAAGQAGSAGHGGQNAARA